MAALTRLTSTLRLARRYFVTSPGAALRVARVFGAIGAAVAVGAWVVSTGVSRPTAWLNAAVTIGIALGVPLPRGGLGWFTRAVFISGTAVALVAEPWDAVWLAAAGVAAATLCVGPRPLRSASGRWPPSLTLGDLRHRASSVPLMPVVALISIEAARQRRSDPGLAYRFSPWVVLLVAVVVLQWALGGGLDWLLRTLLDSIRRLVDFVRAAIPVVVFGAMGVVVLVPSWFLGRLLSRPLDPGGGTWGAERSVVSHTRRSFTGHGSRPAVRQHRRRRYLAIGLALALVVGALFTRQRLVGRDDRLATPLAVADYPWWDDYQRDLRWAFNSPGGAVNQAGQPLLHDVESRYINIRRSVRVEWKAPACGCRRLTVWMFGGSVVFGWGQRDGHTIASEMSRLAARDGIAVDVVNFGVPGELNWESSQKLVWLLGTRQPPDAVVFFDGSNDLRSAFDLNADGPSGWDPQWPIDWALNPLPEALDQNPWVQRFFSRRPDDARRLSPNRFARLSAPRLAELVIDNYDAGRQGASALLAQRGIPVLWGFQPDRYTRPAVEGEPHQDADAERQQRDFHDEARTRLPADVTDYGGVFDNIDRPIYFDDVHTGEFGASVVAEALYGDTLRMLQADRIDEARSPALRSTGG